VAIDLASACSCAYCWDSLRGSDRQACLNLIIVAAPAIAEIGGQEAVNESVQAIMHTCRWWP
jgi:hypothetical protein